MVRSFCSLVVNVFRTIERGFDNSGGVVLSMDSSKDDTDIYLWPLD